MSKKAQRKCDQVMLDSNSIIMLLRYVVVGITRKTTINRNRNLFNRTQKPQNTLQ